MRYKPVTAFFAGLVCGLLLLTALLWRSGRLRTITVAAEPSASRRQDAGAPEPTPAHTDATGTAGRMAPDHESGPRSLIIPVQGVRAADLRDSFAETRGGHRHEAIDIMAPRGTPVLAADEGYVVKLFLSKPGGITVYQFDDSRTYCYYYAHLDRYAPNLKEGLLLRKGDVLGYVGSTGDASAAAPHLHFAIFELGPEKRWWEGTAINPYAILSAPPQE